MSRILDTMKNDLRHVKIEESDDFDDSYVIYDASDEYPFATVYHAGAGYSVFEVINDHFRGVAIDDEKIVATRLTANQAVNAIKQMHGVQYGWKNYKVAPEVYEGVAMRWMGGSIATMHTPGEWGVATINNGADNDEVVSIANGCLVNICSVFGEGEYSEARPNGEVEPSYTVSKYEAKANARLISAAPRMAKVLQRAAYILAELPKSEQTPRMKALRDEIIASIIQATPEFYGFHHG